MSGSDTSSDDPQGPIPSPEKAGRNNKACPLPEPQVGEKRKLETPELDITYTHVYLSEESEQAKRAAAICRSNEGDISGLMKAVAADLHEESANQKSEPCPLPKLKEGEVWRMPPIRCTIMHGPSSASEKRKHAASTD
jgi:hypothetical protein